MPGTVLAQSPQSIHVATLLGLNYHYSHFEDEEDGVGGGLRLHKWLIQDPL